MTSLVQQANVSDTRREVLDIVPFGNNALAKNGARLVTFKLPRRDFINANDIVLYFDLECNGDSNSDDIVCENNIAAIWRSVRVSIGDTEVQYIKNYGQLQTLDDALRWTTEYKNSWGTIAQGSPAVAASGTAVRYGMRLLFNTFLSSGIIPAGKLDQIIVEFEMDDAEKWSTATTAVTETDVTNMVLRVPYLISSELEAKFNTQDVEYSFFGYDSGIDTSMLSGATTHTTVIPTNNNSLNGVLLTMRNQADVLDPNLASGLKYTTSNVTNGLTKFSFNLDGRNIPSKSINCRNQVEMFSYLQEYAGMRKGQEFIGSAHFNTAYDTATDGQFVIAFPLSGLTASTNTISGVNSANTGQLLAQFESLNASVNTQIDFFTRFNRVIRYNRAGGFSTSQK